MPSETPPNLTIGFHAVDSLLAQTGVLDTDVLYIARRENDGRALKILRRFERSAAKIENTSFGALTSMIGDRNHQGVVLKRSATLELSFFELDDLKENQSGIWIILDSIQDPQNLGAIVRTAAGMNVNGIILPKKASAPLGQTAMKTSAGALLKVPFCYSSQVAATLHWFQKECPQFLILAISQHAEPFSADDKSVFNFTEKPLLVVVGSEQGISPLALERAHYTRALPMSNKVESYNVSVAAAMTLYALTLFSHKG